MTITPQQQNGDSAFAGEGAAYRERLRQSKVSDDKVMPDFW